MVKERHIVDYISSKKIKATPEEIEAVQVFSKILVEDYKYPKKNIKTRPQHRVKVRPSDTKKEYPVDIAIFSDNKKQDKDIYIIVECKKSDRQDGITQLQDYLRFSRAYLGVWFNGRERVFIRKVEKKGKIEFEKIPNIPIFGQRVDDIGKFKRQDLQPTHNLKATFKSIRNYLAGNAVGATRDEVLAQQLINLIFCKIYDEKFTEPENMVNFRAGINEKDSDIEERVLAIFESVKIKYKEVLNDDVISLDATSIAYVVGELQSYCLIETERDVIADAFETFIGHALKGGQGQFFTPRNVVKMMVDILDPSDKSLIIDPACGSGGFLIESLRYVWKKIENKGSKYKWSAEHTKEEKMEFAINNIKGVDKDYFLSKVAKAYMIIIGDGKGGIVNEDSLDIPENWKNSTRQKIHLDEADVLITNPPFGTKIPVKGASKLNQYDLGYKWKKDKNKGYSKGKLKEKEAPQILFIERCLDFLCKGGEMAIVLPEGIFGNTSDRYIWNYLLSKVTIKAIISMPEETFQPNTHFKTSILIAKKEVTEKDYKFFMGLANTCGHNKNGKEIYKQINGERILDDEVSLVSKEYRKFQEGRLSNRSHLGFEMKLSDIKDYIFIPDYYDPDLKTEIENYNTSYKLCSIRELIEKKIISVKRGNEVGSQYYGKGDVPFIRTSDIVNWELRYDPIKTIPYDVYLSYKDKQNVKRGDILFIKDGTFLIGGTAYINSANTRIVIQSHINKISVLDENKFDSYYMIYLLNLPIVQKQIKKYTFIQGTISTIGNRFDEILLPIHKDKNDIKKISKKINEIICKKQKITDDITSLIN